MGGLVSPICRRDHLGHQGGRERGPGEGPLSPGEHGLLWEEDLDLAFRGWNVELHDDGDVSGIAVNLAARVEQQAADGELWASSTVRDMMLGGSLSFTDRGERKLKGIEEDWRLFSVSAD
jgi:hypothetical protein